MRRPQVNFSSEKNFLKHIGVYVALDADSEYAIYFAISLNYDNKNL